MSESEKTPESETLTWVADVPLLTNPVMLKATALGLVFTYVLILAIFAGVLASEGDLAMLPSAAAALAIGVGVVAVLIAFVMLVVFGNRMRTAFILDDEGLTYVLVDRRAEIASSLAVFAGAASADATLTGSGLLAAGARRERLKWSRVADARYRPERHYFIGLVAAGWMPVGSMHCTAESYPAVEKRVREILARRKGDAPAG